jgi:hypothetical protein
MGRRKSPKEILREYQVTDDPRGVTAYFGERITQGQENPLSDLSLVEKSDFRSSRSAPGRSARRVYPRTKATVTWMLSGMRTGTR